eukprot:gene22522-16945_t
MDVRDQADGEFGQVCAKCSKVSIWDEPGFIEIKAPVQFNLKRVSIFKGFPMMFRRVAPGIRAARLAMSIAKHHIHRLA